MKMLLPCHQPLPWMATSFHIFSSLPHPQQPPQLTASGRTHNHPFDPSAPHAVPPTLQEREKILDLSSVSPKRTPQYPGSISTYVSPFPADTYRLLSDGADDEDEVIMRALKVRRKVSTEIFKETMRKKGKFGITYTENLASRVPGFIDYLMIEAAALKRLPEFSQLSFDARFRAAVEDSKVVPLIRWLKHNSLSFPQIGKLICMSRGNLESIRRSADWLKSIHVKGRFLGVVLLKSGENLLERSISELDEIVEYLESNGVRREWMGYVMSRSPQLLCYSMEEIKSRAAFYLDMGMEKKDFGTMVFDYPKALSYYTLEEMNQKVNYLREFGLSTECVSKLLAFKPLLMARSIEDQWKPLVKYLYYLGIDRDGMRRMLVIKPMVFCIDLETVIVPKVRFFQDIGIRNDGIGNMLAKFPPLLTYSLYKKIRPVVVFLMTKAGVSKRDIAKVIASGPELLGCSIVHKLDVNVKYFLSLGIRLPQLGEMIADFPMLLRYNVELLRQKYRYLRRVMVRPLQDVIEFPRFFSYSLEGRIIPRHKAMVENRVNFKLRYMLTPTDDEFDQKVMAAIERRQRFESGILLNGLETPQATDEYSETEDGSRPSSADLEYSSEEL
ncbi:hypothetical protein SAY87_025627 [Trapa incisa]|uniref:Embryo defective 2219 n=1 Tax=Trapa incisa TaxID=236973 RepID=A0AAN7JK59_9MYRT|nr:hypothetical protein SAY87_025627 [Trapa incisa]